jgi:hypothetical protein
MNKYQGVPSDPYNGSTSRERVYAWETVPVEYQDRGANDEGYYYEWCSSCGTRTEHEDGDCTACR